MAQVPVKGKRELVAMVPGATVLKDPDAWAKALVQAAKAKDTDPPETEED